MLIRNLEFKPLRSPEGEEGAPDLEGMRAALAFDPFAPPAENGAEGGEGGTPEASQAAAAADEGQGESGDGKPQSASAEPSPTPPAPSDGQASTEGGEDPLAALRGQVQSLLAKAPAQEATPQPTLAPKEGEAPAGKEPAKETPKYDFQIPDSIVEALGAEEPSHRKAALNAIVNSLANKLAGDFSQVIKAIRDEMLEKIPQQVLGQVESRTSVQAIQQDFYTAHPDLAELARSVPGMEQVLWQNVQALARHAGASTWTPEFRDTAAQSIRVALKLPLPQAAQPGKPAPARKAPYSAGGSGGGRPSNGAAGGNEFSEVLSAGI